jgi:hypothetical protein
MLVATALTLALAGFVVVTLADLARQDGLKIIAALHGNSWTANSPVGTRPVTVRFSPRYTAERPVRLSPALRAAA